MPGRRTPPRWGTRRQVRIFGLLLSVALVGAVAIVLVDLAGLGRQVTPAPFASTGLSESPSAAPSPTPSTARTPLASNRPSALPSARSTPSTRSTPPRQTPPPRTPSPTRTSSSAPTAAPSRRPSSPHPHGTAAPTPRPSASRAAPKPPVPSRKRPVGSRGTVYLTFDDGPSPYTQSVLRVLTATRSTATFFQLGINRPHYPQATAAILAQGSNIGNHTYDHTDLTKLSPKEVRRELAGGPRSHCARPPYGATDATVRRVLREQGYRQLLWTVDTLDWTRPGVDWILYHGAPADIGNGSIILMHDGGGPREQTLAALPRIISNLHDRGFRLQRLPGC